VSIALPDTIVGDIVARTLVVHREDGTKALENGELRDPRCYEIGVEVAVTFAAVWRSGLRSVRRVAKSRD
jgi:hypothetical protein